MDVPGGFPLYHEYMKHVHLADAQIEERAALRLVLLGLDMQVVGRAADWLASSEPEAESAKIAHGGTLPDPDLSMHKNESAMVAPSQRSEV